MRKLVLILMVALANAASACDLATSFDALAGSEWEVVRIGDLPAAAEAFLQFRVDGQVAGRTGANSLSGTYCLMENGLSFGPLLTTRMAGSPEAMKQEARLLEVLGSVDGYRRDGIRMTLLAGDKPVMDLRQRDWD